MSDRSQAPPSTPPSGRLWANRSGQHTAIQKCYFFQILQLRLITTIICATNGRHRGREQTALSKNARQTLDSQRERGKGGCLASFCPPWLHLGCLMIYPLPTKLIRGGHLERGHWHLQAITVHAAAIIPPQFREAANSRTETRWTKQPTEDIQHQYLTGTSIYTTLKRSTGASHAQSRRKYPIFHCPPAKTSSDAKGSCNTSYLRQGTVIQAI